MSTSVSPLKLMVQLSQRLGLPLEPLPEALRVVQIIYVVALHTRVG